MGLELGGSYASWLAWLVACLAGWLVGWQVRRYDGSKQCMVAFCP